MTCKNCGYENKLGVRYCQRCGQYIEPKRTLAQEVKSLDFRSLAGVGRRDVNIAPLFTASPVQTPEKHTKRHRLLNRCQTEDGIARTAEH